MKKIYICANYGGFEENYFKLINYIRYVAEKGCVPICPATMYHKALNEDIPQEFEIVSQIAKSLINICDEVWVFGKCPDTVITEMIDSGKPVIHINDNYRLNSDSEAIGVIIRFYESQTGRPVNRSIMEDVVYYLKLGVSDKLIMAAIKKAAKTNAGWNYVEGILRNCYKQGITTLEDFEKRKAVPKAENSGAAYDIDLYEQMINGKD